MPSIKAKFITKDDDKPIKCPKDEDKLRRLPECVVFDYNLLPFQPINPPKPIPIGPPIGPPVVPTSFKLNQVPMENIPKAFNPKLIPAGEQTSDLPAVHRTLYPLEDVNRPTTPYFRANQLPQDDPYFTGYLRGKSSIIDMAEAKIRNRAYDIPATRRTMQSVLDRNNPDLQSYRAGLTNVLVGGEIPLQEIPRTEIGGTNVLVDERIRGENELTRVMRDAGLPEDYIQEQIRTEQQLADERIRPAIPEPARRLPTEDEELIQDSEQLLREEGVSEAEIREYTAQRRLGVQRETERLPFDVDELLDQVNQIEALRRVGTSELEVQRQLLELKKSIIQANSDKSAEEIIRLFKRLGIDTGSLRDAQGARLTSTELSGLRDFEARVDEFSNIDELSSAFDTTGEFSSSRVQPRRIPRADVSRYRFNLLEDIDLDEDPEGQIGPIMEDETGFADITPTRRGLGRRRGFAQVEGDIPMQEFTQQEEGYATNQNTFELDLEDERPYRVRSGGASASDFLSRSRVRMRARATRRLGMALSGAKELGLSMAQGTNNMARTLRTKTGEALKSGYLKTIQSMQQLTPDELADLQRQLNALPDEMGRLPVNFNMTNDPNLDIETGLERTAPDTDDPRPFEDVDIQDIAISARPKLSFRQRLRVARESFGDATQISGSDLAGGGVGMLAAFGVSALLSKANINPYENAAASGFAGDLSARVSTMVGNNIYKRVTQSAVQAGIQTGTEVAAESAGMAALRTGTRLLAGGIEGAGVGVATLPLDILFNKALLNANLGSMENAKAGFLSAAASGTIATGAIGLISLGAAPETFGLSLAVGTAATLISSAISGITGRAQDEKIQDARFTADNNNGVRLEILQMLPRKDINYNFDTALTILQKFEPNQYNKLINQPDFSTFRTHMEQIFTDKPKPIPSETTTPSTDPNTKRANDLFSQKVLHDLIDRVCGTQSTDGCDKLREQQPPPLSDDDKTFLTKQTNDTWEMSVRVIVEQSFQQMKGTQYRIGVAQQYLLKQWNTNQTAAKNLDPYYSQTAFLDPEFRTEYLNNIKIDAQNRVINAYYNNQTKLSDMSPDIQYAAEQDPAFQGLMTKFYSSMEQGAKNLGLSPAQLVDLQTSPVADQPKLYEQMSFDNIKTQTSVVSAAQHLAAEEDKVPKLDYYDIDAVYLSDRDPTSYTKWKPSDSQILQANQAGLSLNEYIRYIHELAKGKDANFSDIKFDDPTTELTDKGVDIDHFQDELQLSGNPLNMYLYDYDKGTITRNPNVPNQPTGSQTEFVSQFRPQYIIQAQNEYAHMVQNLNQSTQADVDDYNAKIRRQLSVFGANYDEMVAGQNDYIARNALTTTPLLAFDRQAYLNQYILHYNPLTQTMPQSGTQQTQQQQQTAGQIYTESGDSYLPIQNDNNGSVLDADKQAEVEYARSQGLTLDQYREAVRTMQVDYGDEENDGDWKRSELDQIMKHERETDNVEDITGDTTTIYTQTGKVIRRTKDGVDITDQTDPNQLADTLQPIVKDTKNTGVDPTDVAGQTRIQIGKGSTP